MWTGRGSRPAETRMCRPCRARRRATSGTSCSQCGQGFTPERSAQRFCSLVCAYASRKGIAPVWATEAMRSPRSLPCKACETDVVTTGAVVLCEACRALRQREHWQGKNRRRRATLRSVASEAYTLTEIARRDGYRCKLCRRKVDVRLKAPHPKSPTVDHIVPLAHGGDDTRINVQLAHWGCNSRKGADCGPWQIALVG